MDFYELSQLDFNILEEKINDNLDILTKKDAVSLKLINSWISIIFKLHLERSAIIALGSASRKRKSRRVDSEEFKS